MVLWVYFVYCTSSTTSSTFGTFDRYLGVSHVTSLHPIQRSAHTLPLSLWLNVFWYVTNLIIRPYQIQRWAAKHFKDCEVIHPAARLDSPHSLATLSSGCQARRLTTMIVNTIVRVWSNRRSRVRWVLTSHTPPLLVKRLHLTSAEDYEHMLFECFYLITNA